VIVPCPMQARGRAGNITCSRLKLTCRFNVRADRPCLKPDAVQTTRYAPAGNAYDQTPPLVALQYLGARGRAWRARTLRVCSDPVAAVGALLMQGQHYARAHQPISGRCTKVSCSLRHAATDEIRLLGPAKVEPAIVNRGLSLPQDTSIKS
jgi:hypothetical protein